VPMIPTRPRVRVGNLTLLKIKTNKPTKNKINKIRGRINKTKQSKLN
jgi:hypothetical protein